MLGGWRNMAWIAGAQVGSGAGFSEDVVQHTTPRQPPPTESLGRADPHRRSGCITAWVASVIHKDAASAVVDRAFDGGASEDGGGGGA